jgi:hypothetical protein
MSGFVVAHLGGIDEIGVFLVPVILAILAVRWAERRAHRRGEPDSEEGKPARND